LNTNFTNRVVSEDLEAILSRELPWQTFSGCRVVVTGAGGFLGGYLVRTLLALFHLGKVDEPLEVVASVREIERARVQLGDCIDDPQLELMSWDLSSIAVPDLGNCQYVLHAASQASPRFYGVDPVGTAMPNTVGTASLLNALQHCTDPRGLLFVSSSEVYGGFLDDRLLTEDYHGAVDPVSARACYAESKRMGETLCVAWHRQFELPVFIVRPFHTYGPLILPNDGRVFADFTYSVIRGENIEMASDGSARRAFCYVSDAIAGFFTVLLVGKPATPYNVANPAAELSMLELAELLVSMYPDKNLKVKNKKNHHEKTELNQHYDRIIPDIQRISNLGWTAQIQPAQGFRRMLEANTK
jgi:UDP-glucuronate decarboxylase